MNYKVAQAWGYMKFSFLSFSVDLKTAVTNIYTKGHQKNNLGALKQSCEISLECLLFF